MKTIAAQTTNGNLIFLNENNEPKIFIKEKMNVCSFFRYHQYTTVSDCIANLPTVEIDTNKLISDEDIINRLRAQNDLLTKENKKLNIIKAFYGNVPIWHSEGFKSESAYQKFIEKQREKNMYDNLKRVYKLNTNKAVRDQICFVFTTEYSGKNGGYKHFNRTINCGTCRISNLSEYNRNKNLIAKKITGEILINRGNIEQSECE